MTQLPAQPDDATLVAWLDDELPPDERERVAAAVAAAPALRARADLLRAARRELAWALAEHAAAAPAGPGANHTAPIAARRRSPRPGLVMLAAAALAVVVVIATWQRGEPTTAAAENDLLTVRLLPRQPAWQLFTGQQFELEGTARTTRACRIVAREVGETDAAALARLAGGLGDAVPLALDGELTGPDGKTQRGPIVRVGGSFAATASRLTVELVDLRVAVPGVAPLVHARLDADGAHEDFLWGPLRVAIPEQAPGCVPQEPGPYRLRLLLRRLGAAGAGEAPFVPLEVATGFMMSGTTSPWSEAVDGLRARLALGTTRPAPGTALAFALQLRNDSDRERCFNVLGVTLAPIPQPFHFDLLVDGEPWAQREDLGVTISWGDSFVPLPIGTSRAVVALADYWQRAGARPSSLRGKHRLALRFHFEPTSWNLADNRLWQGRIDTPPLEVDFGAAR